MGNNRFRLSDMMPNAWFYKLKDMGKIRNHNTNSTHSTKKKQAPAAPTTATLAPSKPKTHNSYPRKSYYFTRELVSTDQKFHNSPINSKSRDTHFLDPPRKSSKQRIRRSRHTKSSPKLVSSSVSAGCSCRTKSDSPLDYSASFSDSSLDQEQDFCDSFPSEFRSDSVLTTDLFDKMESPWSRSSCGCKLDDPPNDNDIIISVDKKSLASKLDNLDVFDHVSDFDLPPIITKPSKFDEQVEEIREKKAHQEPTKYRRSSAKYEETNISHGSFSVKVVKEDCVAVKEHKPNNSVRRQHSVTSPGVRLRVHSPRISNRKIQAYNGRKSVSSTTSSCLRSRRTLSDSLAIVKSSFDPQRDFRESMVEMIVQNNIRASKDLEDLLACYLSLNSDEYHDLIVKVFKQIWFDLTDIKVKSSFV